MIKKKSMFCNFGIKEKKTVKIFIENIFLGFNRNGMFVLEKKKGEL